MAHLVYLLFGHEMSSIATLNDTLLWILHNIRTEVYSLIAMHSLKNVLSFLYRLF